MTRIEHTNGPAHDIWLERIDDLFSGRLSPATATDLYAHIKSCERCERTFERFAEAERALFSSPAHPDRDRALTPFALDRVRERLLLGPRDALDPVRSKNRLARIMQSAGMCALTRWPVTLAAALCAGALFFTITPTTRVAEEELRARSGDVNHLSSKVSLRALRVRSSEGGGFSVTDLGGKTASLAPGDRVKVLYTNLDTYRLLTVEILAGDGRSRARIETGEIESGVEDASAGAAIEVDDTWPEGPLRIVGLFAMGTPAAVADLRGASPSDADGVAIRVVEAHVGKQAAAPSGVRDSRPAASGSGPEPPATRGGQR